MKYAIALIVAGLVLLFYGGAKADWQIHVWNGKEWVPATSLRGRPVAINIEKEACEMDLANWRMVTLPPDGIRFQCRRVK